MRNHRSIAVGSLLLTLAGCRNPARSPAIDAAAPPADVASTDASTPDVALEPLPDVSEAFPADASVRARPVVRSAAAVDRWQARSALERVGSAAAFDARLQRINALRAEARERAERALQAQRPALGLQPLQAIANTAAASAERGGLGAGRASEGARARPTTAAAPSGAAPASITNNQVANVDEGDIVKASGDDLIILRRGHLFRVSLANGGVRRVGDAPAFAPGVEPGDYYDELLVDGDIALVLGYSNDARATEVNRFRLERGGQIRYLDTFYIRSNDYYSSENYATRLVNGQFVMYLPVSLGEARSSANLQLPALRNGRTGAYRTVLDVADVFVARADDDASTIHAVVQCSVHGPTVDCTARGMLADSSSTFYVSNSATYVWTDSGYRNAREGRRSWIVRLPHARSESPGAAQIEGAPVDQFAFDERDNALHVLLREDGYGARTWNRYGASGGLSALKIPLSQIVGTVTATPDEAYTLLLPRMNGGHFEERWVGDYAVFAFEPYERTARYAFDPETRSRSVFAYRATDQTLFELRSEQRVDRIEPLGRDALIVGNAGATMVLTPIALDGGSPEPYAPLRLDNRAEGDSRSHGFFFSPSGPRAGVFGIATTGESSYDSGPGSADVSFFRVQQLALRSLGTVTARRPQTDRCSTSCYDWYGNARPIFWGSRVFALMGDEVVETALGASAMTERRRVDFGAGVRGVVEE